MIRMNDEEYEYQSALSLKTLILAYYTDITKVNFDDYIILINDDAVPSAQAEVQVVQDHDTIYIIPKMEGG